MEMKEYIGLFPLFPINRAPMGVFDFTRQIDTVYGGLGIPTFYGVLSLLANKSVFYIGGRGTGKTRIINLIPNLHGTVVEKWDSFTLGELNDYCCRISDSNEVKGKHLVFKVEEFSTLSDYHREIFLTVCSKIISDGNYSHVTNHMPFLSIQDCKLTLLIAIQPRLYSLLCNRYTQWESMSYDRFSKFLLLNPLRSKTIDVPFIPTLPQKISDHPTFRENRLNLERVVSMYKGHVSEGRAFLYARDYVIALARFMNANEVEQNHVDMFYELFHPYLNSFSILQQAEDLDSAVEVRTGKMKLLTQIARYGDEVSKEKLARDLHVTPRHIERCAKELNDAGLVSKPQRGEYCLSEELRGFFRKYGDTFRFP